MAEVEMNHVDNISVNLSTFNDKDDYLVVAGEVQQDRVNDMLLPKPTSPLVDIEPTKEVEKNAEILPTFTLSSDGVEEVNGQVTDDEAAVNGFPAQNKSAVNDLATIPPSVPTPSSETSEGFEELNAGVDEKPLVNDLATITPSIPTPSSETLEGFEKLNAGDDEKPLVNDLSTITPFVPQPSSETLEEFEELNAGVDEKPLVNDLATITPSVPTPSSETLEGFEELDAGVDEKPLVNDLAIITPSVPTPSSETPEGLDELNEGADEKPQNDKKEDLRSPLALWIIKQNFHPELVRLIYWFELRRTTGVFGGALLLLLSLRFYSLIGVVTTFALSLLVVAFLYRIGMTIVKAVKKTSVEHPFKHLLEEKIEISEEVMQYWSTKARQFINKGVRKTQCLFLVFMVKDTVSSLKTMIIFWLISYYASCIDFLSICTLGTLVLFTVPKLYEEKQSEIDHLFSFVKEKSCLACGMIEDKLPEKIIGYLKKTKSE